MAEFTKEQLIGWANSLIEETHTDISISRTDAHAESYRAQLELLEIALAALTAPQLPQTAVETTHSSVIAEQLAHVLSGMDVTDHQRAIISCAVDRLNKNAEKIQQKPACFTVPDALDYQGAKELFNYLMNEEEANATVSGWNACRAAMLQAGNSPVTPDDVLRMDWLVSKTVDVREPMVYGSHSIFWSQTITDEDDDYHATKLREQIDAAMAAEQAAAPQQEDL